MTETFSDIIATAPAPSTVEPSLQDRQMIEKALLYFSIFNYPLTHNEIYTFLEKQLESNYVDEILQVLVKNHRVFKHGSFYALVNDPLLVEERIKANTRANEAITKAQKVGRFLYQFPFVRAVGISGSLSKNVADEKADFDFFIITQANRLWIARTMMHIYKKFTFLAGRQHRYCMNYYVDEEGMQLTNQNIFTAIEIKTLLPVAGKQVIDDFFLSNEWVNSFLPVCPFKSQDKPDKRKSWIKRLGEWVWNGTAGDKLDDYLLAVTTKRWEMKRKRGLKNDKGISMGLDTGKHFARSNPGDFQEKVLALYAEGLKRIQKLT